MDDRALRRATYNEARRRKRKSRGRGLRKTTGCSTCKRRHLRCDEARPECGPCVKSKQSCFYEGALPLPSRLSPSTEPAVVSPARSEDATVANGPGADIVSPPVSITNSQLVITSESNRSFQPAPTPPDAAFYRWFGLLAGDADVDDENGGAHRLWFPSADATGSIQPSLINGLSLEAFKERYAIPSDVAPCLSALPLPEATSRDSWHGSQPPQLSDEELRLFDNFVKRVSLWIDIHDPHSLFSTLVPHLAMRDAGLMTAILALSSRHLSIVPDASNNERDRRVGLQYYYDTLRYLQQAMSIEAYTTSLELLATALIVSMYEMLDDSGSSSGWGRHLKGVFWIQRSQLIQGETGGLRSAVWWAWMRQDIWAAYCEKRKTLSFWTPTKAYSAMTAYEKAARIVWIFAKAVDYCSDEEVSAGDDRIRARLDRAEVVLEMLDEWERNLPHEFAPLPVAKTSSSSNPFEPIWIHPSAFGVSMQLLHTARILILLNKPSLGGLREYVGQQRLVATAATTVCRIATTIADPASSLICSQCLYIAGLTLQDSDQRDSVVDLIDSCHKRIGWPQQSMSGDLRDEWAKLDRKQDSEVGT